MENRVYLSYENYRRLDVITRQKIGKPLLVIDTDQYKQEFPGEKLDFGHVGLFKGLVTRVPAEGGGYVDRDMGDIISTFNYINLDAYHRADEADWIDRREIPKELIYDYIVWHEIAHIIHGDIPSMRHMIEQGLVTEDEVINKTGNGGPIKALQEYRADCYAWSKVFPGRDMPGRFDSPNIERGFRHGINILSRKYGDALEMFKLGKIEPISLDPEEYIPAIHAECGLPIIDLNNPSLPGKVLPTVTLFKRNLKAVWATTLGKITALVFLSGFVIAAYGLLWLQPVACILGCCLVIGGSWLTVKNRTGSTFVSPDNPNYLWPL